MRVSLCYTTLIGACVSLMLSMEQVHAAYCDGASHITCYEGIDQSGRTPGQRYDMAVEGLTEAKTNTERELARRAMKDALDPSTSNPRAVECNQPFIKGRSFSACMAGKGPASGLTMNIPCQQNLDDGRLLVDGQSLPTGSHYKVTRYIPSSNEMGWSHGTCDIVFTRK